MNHHKELAKSYFLKGYNCAQSVVLAFHEELGLDEETAARMASAFGGGMAACAKSAEPSAECSWFWGF